MPFKNVDNSYCVTFLRYFLRCVQKWLCSLVAHPTAVLKSIHQLRQTSIRGFDLLQVCYRHDRRAPSFINALKQQQLDVQVFFQMTNADWIEQWDLAMEYFLSNWEHQNMFNNMQFCRLCIMWKPDKFQVAMTALSQKLCTFIWKWWQKWCVSFK